MEFRAAPSQHQPNHAATQATAAPAPAHHQTPVGAKGESMKKRRMLVLVVLALLLLAAAVGTAAYYINRYHDSQQQVKKLSSNPTLTAQQQQQDLINKIGKLTVLPTGETPTVATVTDITKLTDQPFFANAKNGDKVLIYTQAKKAYLYRPSTNKLINIAPVNIGSDQTSTSGTTNTTQSTTNTTKKTP